MDKVLVLVAYGDEGARISVRTKAGVRLAELTVEEARLLARELLTASRLAKHHVDEVG